MDWRDVENERPVRRLPRRGDGRGRVGRARGESRGSAGSPPGGARHRAVDDARWALQGRLVSLDDSVLDTVAKRRRVDRPPDARAHGRYGQPATAGRRAGGCRFRWAPDRPKRIPADVRARAEAELPSDDDEGLGHRLPSIRARMDAVLDSEALRFASLDAAALAMPASWSLTPVDIGFRLGSLGLAHLRAHHPAGQDPRGARPWPTEVERIVRDLHTAWGRLESRIWPAESTTPAVDEILARMSATLTARQRASSRRAGVTSALADHAERDSLRRGP